MKSGKLIIEFKEKYNMSTLSLDSVLHHEGIEILSDLSGYSILMDGVQLPFTLKDISQAFSFLGLLLDKLKKCSEKNLEFSSIDGVLEVVYQSDSRNYIITDKLLKYKSPIEFIKMIDDALTNFANWIEEIISVEDASINSWQDVNE